MTADPLIPLLEQRLRPYLRAIATDLRRDADSLQAEALALPTLPMQLWRKRRARDRSFGRHAHLLGEPCWDMLLAIAGAERPLSVSGACHMSGGPHTTGLRRLQTLIDGGLVHRSGERGVRDTSLLLTDEGHAIMTAALRTAS